MAILFGCIFCLEQVHLTSLGLHWRSSKVCVRWVLEYLNHFSDSKGPGYEHNTIFFHFSLENFAPNTHHSVPSRILATWDGDGTFRPFPGFSNTPLWVSALISGFCKQNSEFLTRITSLYGYQTSPVVLCMQNSVINTRITCPYGSQPSSVAFGCKTATFGPE